MSRSDPALAVARTKAAARPVNGVIGVNRSKIGLFTTFSATNQAISEVVNGVNG